MQQMLLLGSKNKEDLADDSTVENQSAYNDHELKSADDQQELSFRIRMNEGLI